MKLAKDKLKELLNLVPGENVDITEHFSWQAGYGVISLISVDQSLNVEISHIPEYKDSHNSKGKVIPASTTITTTHKVVL